MNPFDYPITVGLAWRLLLLLLAWGMYYVLAHQHGSRAAWVGLLQALRVVPKEPEEETPLYSKTKVLVVRPAEDVAPVPEPEPEPDYTQVIDRSRLLFKMAGVLVILELCRFGFMSYRLYNPYFLYGPDTRSMSSPTDHAPLPPPIPGAGGGGAIQATVGPTHGPGHVFHAPGSANGTTATGATAKGAAGTTGQVPGGSSAAPNPFATPPPPNHD